MEIVGTLGVGKEEALTTITHKDCIATYATAAIPLLQMTRIYKCHRIQHWYVWLLYGLLAIKWQLFDDFYNIAVAPIGPYRVARPKG